jgi:ribonuclease HIII
LSDIPESLKTLLDESRVEITGSRQIDHGTQYHLARRGERATLNVYHTGKVLEGGKPSGLRDLLEGWRLSRREGGAARCVPRAAEPALDATRRIGTDEAGKGDYFGPLVVAGVRVSGERVASGLREIGVRDSKTLGVERAGRLAARILETLGPDDARVVALPPREYEIRRRAAGDVNRLLVEINHQIISELEDEVEVVVVDEFARSARSYLEPFMPEGVRLEVRVRAEDDAAVAAASVLARARYLEEMEELSARVGFELPRGSTRVLGAARRVMKEMGEEGLKDVAKVHFATTAQVLGG